MKTIWKYDLGNQSSSKIKMPAAAILRHVGIDPKGKLCSWMEVDNEFEDMEEHTFGIFMTGNPIPDGWIYVDTLKVGSLMLHIYHYSQLTPVVKEDDADWDR